MRKFLNDQNIIETTVRTNINAQASCFESGNFDRRVDRYFTSIRDALVIVSLCVGHR